MTLKILHLADLHLDHPFPGASATSQAGNQRRTGLRQALQSALALAQSRQVDAVTIGGDLVDAASVSPDTAIFLRQQFAQIAPIQVYIAPGARDPYTSDSLYAYMEWPSNVHIFTEPRLTAVDLPDEVQLWGLAYDSAAFAHTSLADLDRRRWQEPR